MMNMPLRSRAIVASVFLFAASCSPASVSTHARLASHPGEDAKQPGRASNVHYISPARFIPDLRAIGLSVFPYRDGDVETFSVNGFRVSRKVDGGVVLHPGKLSGSRYGGVSTVRVSDDLGGGFLFLSTSGGKTRVWHAPTWGSELEPVITLNRGNAHIIPGFDRLYALSGVYYGRREARILVPFSVTSSDVLPLGSLPRPAYFAFMAFDPPWRAAVVADWRGAMVTSDSGVTWRPVKTRGAIKRITKVDGNLAFETSRELTVLLPDGSVTVVRKRQVSPSKRGDGSSPSIVRPGIGWGSPTLSRASRGERRPKQASKNYAHEAVAHGVVLSKTRVLLIEGTDLLHVSARDGALVKRVSRVLDAPFESCDGLRLGSGVGFACVDRGHRLHLLQVDGDDGVHEVLRMSTPPRRIVSTSPIGAVVVSGPCPGNQAEDRQLQSSSCVIHPDMSVQQIDLRGASERSQVVPLRGNRIAVFSAPTPLTRGVIVSSDGGRTPAFLSYRATSHANLSTATLDALRTAGAWLPGMFEKRPGVLGGWVQLANSIYGVEVNLDGVVTVGPVKKMGAGKLLVSGRFAFVWSNFGRGFESVDGGMSWKKLPIPAWGKEIRYALGERKCSAVGCIVGPWTKLGWLSDEKRESSERLELPKRSKSPSFFPTKLTLDCEPSGKSSPPPAPLVKPRPSPHKHRRRTWRRHLPPTKRYGVLRPVVSVNDWLPLGAYRPPTLRSFETFRTTGRDYGNRRYRLYAVTNKESGWTNGGRWWLAADEPFSLGAPWTSKPAPLDQSVAAISSWRWQVNRIAWDNDTKSALLTMCGGARCYVMVASEGEEGRLLTRADGKAWSAIDSAVRVADSWYVLMGRASYSTALFRIDSAGVGHRITSYPRAFRGDLDSQIIRTVDGSGLGLWVTDVVRGRPIGRTIIQLDPSSGRIVDSFLVPMAHEDRLSRLPGCAPGAQGWEVTTSWPGYANIHVSSDQMIEPTDMLVRLVVNRERVCVRAVAVNTREIPSKKQRGVARRRGTADWPVSLTVWDRSKRRKFGYRCQPTQSEN